MLVAVETGAPYTLQQFTPTKGLAGVSGQKMQQIELPQRQRHGGVALQQLTARGVELPGAEAQHRCRRWCCPELLHTPQQGTHPGHQLQHRKRLGQVVVGAQLQPQHAVGLGRPGAEHDHRHIRVAGSQVAADLPAIGAGQHQVQQHQVPALAVDRCHRQPTVGLAVQVVAGLLEVQAQRIGDGVVIFNQQQVLGHGRFWRMVAEQGGQPADDRRAAVAAGLSVGMLGGGAPASPWPANRPASAHSFAARARQRRKTRSGRHRCRPQAGC